MALTDSGVKLCWDKSIRFQGVGKVFSSSLQQARRVMSTSLFLVFIGLFFAGPQFGSLDADLDGVAEVPVICSTAVPNFELRDTAALKAMRPPQISAAACLTELTDHLHLLAVLLPSQRPNEQDSPTLRC